METKRTRHDYMEDISTPGEGTHNTVWTVRKFRITIKDILECSDQNQRKVKREGDEII